MSTDALAADGRSEPPKGLWPRMLRVFVYLPTIVVLASLTLVLDEWGAFKRFDESMLALVVALRGSANPHADGQSHANLVTVIISEEMFAGELERTLPIRKELLDGALCAVASTQPSLVAIDIEAVPEVSLAAAGAADGPPMHTYIQRLLRRGISVVAVAYPRKLAQEKDAHDWRRRLCDAAPRNADRSADRHADNCPSPKPAKSVGKLYWASSLLETEGRSASVFRYYKPEDAATVASLNHGLLPLGMVIAAALDEKRTLAPALHAVADYCLQVQDFIPGYPNAEVEKKRIRPDPFINYFGDRPLEVVMNSSLEFSKIKPVNEGQVVVLGVNSFQGVDEHVTPNGSMPGAMVHALVAASVLQNLDPDHLYAFLIDIGCGLVFMALFLVLHDLKRAREQSRPEARALIRLHGALMPLLPLLVVGLLILFAAPWAVGKGLWLNPLPIFVGLLIHVYVELTGSESEHVMPRQALQAWKARLCDMAQRCTDPRALDAVARWNLGIGVLLQGFKLVLLGMALFLLGWH